MIRRNNLRPNKEEIAKTGLAIILFLVLSITPSVDFLPFWNPTITGKFIFFSLLIASALLCSIAISIYYGSNFQFDLLDLILFGYLILIILKRYVFTPLPNYSIRYMELFGLVALYLIVKANKDEKIIQFLFLAVIVGADLQILEGLLQQYAIMPSNNDNFKVTGSFFNSGPYAGYLATVFPISLELIKRHYNDQKLVKTDKQVPSHCNLSKIYQYTILLNLAGSIIIIPMLRSRASFLAILAGSFFVFRKEITSFLRFRLKNKFIKYAVPCILVAGLIAGFFVLISAKNDSSKGRYLILSNTVQMIRNKPLTGFGFDRFKTNYMNFQSNGFRNGLNKDYRIYADNVYYAFNEPLQVIAENGLIGFLILLTLIVTTLLYAGKSNMVPLSCIGLISALVFSLFSYSSEILPIKLNGVFFFAVISAQYKGSFKCHFNLKSIAKYPIPKIINAGCIVLLLFSFLCVVIQISLLGKGYYNWRTAYIQYSYDNFTESKIEYVKLYPIFRNDGDFLVNYGKTLYFTGDYTKAITTLTRAKSYINNTVLETALGDCEIAEKNYSAAECEYYNAYYMAPERLYTKHLLFKLYQKSGELDKAGGMARDIISSKIKLNSDATDSIMKEAKLFLENR